MSTARERLVRRAPANRWTAVVVLAHSPPDSCSSRTVHSCGSAPVLHRLPPPRRRDLPGSGTARTIRGCARPLSSAHPRGMRSATATTRPWHSVAWLVWALAGAATVQLAPSPVYVALIVGIAWLVVEVHAPDGPYRRAFPALLVVGVVFALIRVLISALTAHPGVDVLMTLPEVTVPRLLGGFTLGGTVEAGVVLQIGAAGFFAIGNDGGLRRFPTRDRLALRARAVGAARLPRARCRHDGCTGVRAVDHRVRSSPSGKPTGRVPAVDRSDADASCAASCPCSSQSGARRSRSRSRWMRGASPTERSAPAAIVLLDGAGSARCSCSGARSSRSSPGATLAATVWASRVVGLAT